MDQNTFEIENLRIVWNAYKNGLCDREAVDRTALSALLRRRSSWLAPSPKAFAGYFGLCIVFFIFESIFGDRNLWPLAVLSALGMGLVIWRTTVRDRIRRLEGGVAGTTRRLLRFRRTMTWMSVIIWVVLAPFFVWYAREFGPVIWGDDARSGFWFMAAFVAICVAVFVVSLRKTLGAIRDTQACLDEVARFESDEINS